MHYLHVIQRYRPARLTGSEMAMAILCESLARQTGDRITLVTSTADPGEAFYDPRFKRFRAGSERRDRLQIVRLPVAWWWGSLYYLAAKVLPFLLPLSGGRLAFQAFGPHLVNLEREIVRQKSDLIHVAPMPMTHLYHSWRIAKKHRIPLVVTPTMHFEDRSFINPLIYAILQDANAVIAHTEYERNELVKRGIAAEKITVVGSSYLTEDDFQAGDGKRWRQRNGLTDEPVVLFIGSKSYDKGTLDLLSVWPAVRQALPEARLVIAGVSTNSWLEGKKGKDMAGVMELDFIDEQSKHDLLRACDIVAVPSRAESFGMILLEAWAKAKPVIGGSAGATKEMIADGGDGYTVDFGDQEQLKLKIIELLNNKERRRTFGQAGLRKAKQFTEKKMVEKTLEAYRLAIAK